MPATRKFLFDLTAADLQTHQVVTLSAAMSLRDAAEALFAAGVHGAPVVNDDGQCIGVLSVTDVARWGVRQSQPEAAHPRTCGNQETHRGRDGSEKILCTLPEGKCPLQTEVRLPGGQMALECQEPHSVLLEWQMVEMESLPTECVRNYMTAEPVTVEPGTPITQLARQMIDSSVQRVIVVDADQRPTGIVTVTDLVTALAEVSDERDSQ